MTTSSKCTPEAIEEMRATVRAKEAKRAEVQAANDARRVAAFNAASVAYNEIAPLLHAEAAKGIKLKNDGSVTKRDKDRIDQVVADCLAKIGGIPNGIHGCRAYWAIKSGGSVSLQIQCNWQQDSDHGGLPNMVRAEVYGFCFIRDYVGTPSESFRPFDQMEVMKTDRTAEAVAAARIEFKQVEQQIADLNHKLSALKRVTSC